MKPTTNTGNPRLQQFREQYRAEIPGWYRGYAHLAAIVVMSLVAIGTCLWFVEDIRPLEWLAVPLTFLYANLVEYFGHRGPMHHRVRGLGLIHRRHSLQHHRFFSGNDLYFDDTRDFRAVLFPVLLVVFFLGLAGIPTAIVLALVFSGNVALLSLATAIAYYLNYELLHFAYHARPDTAAARLPLVATLRRLHHRHHQPDGMGCNFNITYPIADWLFGTLYRPAKPGSS